MITLRPMKAEEFASYRDYFIVDYAAELIANYGYTPEKSQAVAKNDLASDLPQNTTTPNHTLLCLEQPNNSTVGYLWYKLLDDSETIFILDFMVFDQFRGLGYGKAAMMALEKQLFQTGIEQIKLRVAFHNKRALGLYKKLGFTITGYNMVKLREAAG